MPEITARLGEVDDLHLGRKRFPSLVLSQFRAPARLLKHNVRQLLDADRPIFLASNVIDFSRDEPVGYVCKGSAGILNIVENAAVAPVFLAQHRLAA